MKFLYALLYIAALGILSHFIGQALPRSWFSAERFPYCAAEWENGGKVYEKLGIKHWKDFLPDMSRIMPDMVKKKVTKQSREQGMGVLIAETCVAECVHFWLIVLSLGIFSFWRGGWAVVLRSSLSASMAASSMPSEKLPVMTRQAFCGWKIISCQS